MNIFIRFLSATIFLFLSFIADNTLGQCAYNGRQENASTFTIGCSNQAWQVGSGAFQRFTVTSGVVYDFNTCGSTYDTQITGFNSGGAVVGLYNDDNASGNNACGGGVQSGVNWTATFSGELRVQLNTYNCTNWPGGGSATLNYRIAPPTTSTNGGNQTVCQSVASSGLGGNTPSIGTGTWTANSGNVSFSNVNTPNATATASAGGSYALTWTINNGVCTSASSLTLTVNSNSTNPTGISGSSAYCTGDAAVTLTATGGTEGAGVNSGAGYQWYAGSCGGGSVLGTGNSIAVSPGSTTSYFVRRNGTCNQTSCFSTTVTVKTPSVAPTGITGTTTICSCLLYTSPSPRD